jgi:hypothetical protein
MIRKHVDVQELDEAFLTDHGLHQALIYYWDHLDVVHQNPVPPNRIDRDQLVEGFWFGERTMLYLFRTDEALQAVYGEDTNGKETLDETLLIDHRRRAEWGAKLLVRHYLEPDEDGQYHDVYARPVKLMRDSDETEAAADE